MLVGDQAQLPSIGAGGMFAELQSQVPTAELSEVHRANHEWEREAWALSSSRSRWRADGPMRAARGLRQLWEVSVSRAPCPIHRSMSSLTTRSAAQVDGNPEKKVRPRKKSGRLYAPQCSEYNCHINVCDERRILVCVRVAQVR